MTTTTHLADDADATEPDAIAAAGATDEPENSKRDSEERDRFKKSVAILLATLAILGGVIAVLETFASTSESHAARETTRTAVVGLAAQVEANALQQVTIELAETPALQERARAETAALHLEATSNDLRRAALTDTRIGWNSRASQFGTVLTVLAIAVFLAGFALVVHSRIRLPILVPGIVLGLVCAGWAVHIHLRGVPETADATIEATAAGVTALERGEYQAARSSFEEAIRIEDDYAPAYEGRGVATFLRANPDFFAVGTVIDDSNAVRASARADLERAMSVGPDHNLYAQTLLGILDLYGPDPASAVGPLEDALQLDDAAPELWFALAAAHVAAGDTDAADESLASGLALLDQRQPSGATRQLAAEALTSFEWVRAHVSDPAPAARLAQELVALEASFVAGRDLRPERADEAEFVVERATFDGEVLHLTATFDVPQDTVISALVYERPASDAPWAQASDLGLIATLSASGQLDESVELERACLPVELRVDLHAEGVLVEQVVVDGVDELVCVGI